MKIPGSLLCKFYRRILGAPGFTLLEIMIAIALLAIGFVTLFGSQSRSLSRVTEAQFNNIAPILASGKLAEMESGILPIAENDGNFAPDYPDYSWHLDVENVDLSSGRILPGIATQLTRVSLAVVWGETKFLYTLTSYVRRKD